jgi:hypothetical protein
MSLGKKTTGFADVEDIYIQAVTADIPNKTYGSVRIGRSA